MTDVCPRCGNPAVLELDTDVCAVCDTFMRAFDVRGGT